MKHKNLKHKLEDCFGWSLLLLLLLFYYYGIATLLYFFHCWKTENCVLSSKRPLFAPVNQIIESESKSLIANFILGFHHLKMILFLKCPFLTFLKFKINLDVYFWKESKWTIGNYLKIRFKRMFAHSWCRGMVTKQ